MISVHQGVMADLHKQGRDGLTMQDTSRKG